MADTKRAADERAADLQRVKDAAAAEVRAAEAKANREQGGLKSGATPVPFAQIYGGETVTGTLVQVDCLNGPRRLTIQNAKSTVKVLVRGTEGLNPADFTCGVAEACPPGDGDPRCKARRAVGNHRERYDLRAALMSRIPLRWIAIGVFVLSSSLNYLDRQLLAALAPTVRGEFQLSNEQYGLVISSFSMVYAVVAPAAGWFIDRVGLNLGAAISVALWSVAGSATAFTRSFSGLLACRTVLGAAEAAGIPATGKANATYLEPRELALGTAFNQVGITLGSVAAPLLVTFMQPRYGWRSAFALCGALGFLWIPLWWFTSKTSSRAVDGEQPRESARGRPAARSRASGDSRSPMPSS